MLFHPGSEDRLGDLEKRIRRAHVVTADLLNEVMDSACTRGGARHRIKHLIAVGAFTDAALALVEVELPRWRLRRLVHDEGEWLCSLSREPGLPRELDEVAEGCHEILPLAMLMALILALEAAEHADAAVSVPQIRAGSGQAACCDNFG